MTDELRARGDPAHRRKGIVLPSSLFSHITPDAQCHPHYLLVRDHPAYTGARLLLDEISSQASVSDRNFVRDFQSRGFDARIWELALFAYSQEVGLQLSRALKAPDLIVREPVPFAIEATTSNPTQDSARSIEAGDEPAPDVDARFVFHMGKALRRKLTKRFADGLAYWDQPHVAGLPFVIALQAFHDDTSLSNTVGPLATYLYGREDQATFDAGGHLQLQPRPVTQHTFAGKEIPSGLFRQPEAAQLSAVLFSNSGTIALFNRIATQQGLSNASLVQVRIGEVVNPDPHAVEPAAFGYLVNEGQREAFADSMHIMLNPYSETQLSPEAAPRTTIHTLRPDGLVEVKVRGLGVMRSKTLSFVGPSAAVRAKAVLSWYLRYATEQGRIVRHLY